MAIKVNYFDILPKSYLLNINGGLKMWGIIMAIGLLAAIITIVVTAIVAIRRTGTWKKWCISFIISVIIFSVGIENMSSNKISSPGINSLGFTPDQFKDSFNAAAEEMRFKLKIDDFIIEGGSVKYTFTKSLVMSGTVNKEDNSIKEIFIMGHGDGTAMSALNIMMAIGTIIATTSPELSADERGNLIRELRLAGDDMNLSNYSGKAIRGDMKYWVNSSEALGIVFGAISADSK